MQLSAGLEKKNVAHILAKITFFYNLKCPQTFHIKV